MEKTGKTNQNNTWIIVIVIIVLVVGSIGAYFLMGSRATSTTTQPTQPIQPVQPTQPTQPTQPAQPSIPKDMAHYCRAEFADGRVYAWNDFMVPVNSQYCGKGSYLFHCIKSPEYQWASTTTDLESCPPGTLGSKY